MAKLAVDVFRRRMAGFTLIEVLTVLAIIFILTARAIPFYPGMRW